MIAGDPVTAGLNTLNAIIERIFPDANDQAKAKVMLMSAEFQPMLAQLEVNKAEASSHSVFVAGWRPFVGWGLGLTIVMAYCVGPFLNWAGLWLFNKGALPPSYPAPDAVVLELLGGLLGLGMLRSFDKAKGVATEVSKIVKK